MATQPIDRMNLKKDSKVLKRNKPALVRRSNKVLVESVNSSHGPQVTDGLVRYIKEMQRYQFGGYR